MNKSVLDTSLGKIFEPILGRVLDGSVEEQGEPGQIGFQYNSVNFSMFLGAN